MHSLKMITDMLSVMKKCASHKDENSVIKKMKLK